MTLLVLAADSSLSPQWMESLPHGTKVVLHPGVPFEYESIRLLARHFESVVVDDRIHGEVQAVCPDAVRLSQTVESGLCLPPANMDPTTRNGRSGTLGTVVFGVSNDTHVRMLAPLASRVQDHLFLALDNNEGADRALREQGEQFLPFPPRPDHFSPARLPLERLANFTIRTSRHLMRPDAARRIDRWVSDRRTRHPLLKVRPDVVVLGCDWGVAERQLCRWASQAGIPTVCIQEGPQDFDLPGLRQMQTVDYVFAQGGVTVRYLPRRPVFLTGNPKLHDLAAAPLPRKPVVMINANFTYGVFEDWRDRWIGGAVQACVSARVDYFVSRHPRDRGAYDGLPVRDSNAFVLYDHIRDASIVVTRFSQVVYESLLMGRDVIYYNPHGEVKRTLTDDRSGAYVAAETPEQLLAALQRLVYRTPRPSSELRREFIDHHCCRQDGLAVDRCVAALTAVAGRPAPKARVA